MEKETLNLPLNKIQEPLDKINKLLNKLKDEKSKILMQLSEAPNPLLGEVIIQGVHRVQALTWVIRGIENVLGDKK